MDYNTNDLFGWEEWMEQNGMNETKGKIMDVQRMI